MLTVLQEDFARLKTAITFLEALGKPYRKSNTRLTVDLITKRFEAASSEWEGVVQRLDGIGHKTQDAQQRSETKAEDNLVAWLSGLQIESAEDDRYALDENPTARPSTVLLHRCSYCHNPSAALRRCGGCGETR